VSLTISVRQQDDLTLAVLEGELDLATTPILRAQVVERHDPADVQLVLDVSRVTVIDSPALGVLLRLAHRAEAGARRLGLVTGEDDRLTRLLRITHLERAFTVGEDLRAVRTALAAADSDAKPEPG
jgi:anti-anti-sigma factor